MAKDAFSGQIIVCCVIMAFIAAFLLREWVMANQPHPHAINGAAEAPVNGNALIRPGPGEQVLAQALRDAERGQHELDAHLAGEERRGAALEQMDHLIDEALRQNATPGTSERGTTPQLPEAHETQDPQSHSDALPTERALSPALARARSPEFGRASSPGMLAQETGNAAAPLSPFASRGADLSKEDFDRTFRASSFAEHGLLFSGAEGAPDIQDRRDEQYRDRDPTPDSAASSVYSTSDDGVDAGNDMIRPKHRVADPDDLGIESASDGELEPETPAAMIIGPAAAAPAGAAGHLRRAHVHDHGNDSDDEDDDDPLFGPDPGANVAFAPEDPLAMGEDDNPDDLFFEADLQGILEAVGIHGPVFALLQNVALVALLIASLLVVAVWVPLMFGKTVAAVSCL